MPIPPHFKPSKPLPNHSCDITDSILCVGAFYLSERCTTSSFGLTTITIWYYVGSSNHCPAVRLHLGSRYLKNTSGDWRRPWDYRFLNNATVPFHHPIPHIQDFTVTLHGTTIFSNVDLIRMCHQIPVDPDDIPKTAVTTPFSLFKFLWMPFGLRNTA